ncbi:hypothetical protein Hdeb2414_s0014g00430881 [Helianthus debilis subsp. tardiflorus]
MSPFKVGLTKESTIHSEQLKVGLTRGSEIGLETPKWNCVCEDRV